MARHHPGRVAPFGDPRITARRRLPAAFRSPPRPSSALGAQASPARPMPLGAPPRGPRARGIVPRSRVCSLPPPSTCQGPGAGDLWLRAIRLISSQPRIGQRPQGKKIGLISIRPPCINACWISTLWALRAVRVGQRENCRLLARADSSRQILSIQRRPAGCKIRSGPFWLTFRAPAFRATRPARSRPRAPAAGT
jgi:hypothetical protein